jgi:hypothetical protein
MRGDSPIGRPTALLLVAVLGACAPAPAPPVVLVLTPPTSEQARPEAEQRGVLELLALRLRALRGIELRIDADGCALSGASHALRVARRSTGLSDITAVELQDCASARTRQETFIHPIAAPRDWTHALAWWVAGQLDHPPPQVREGARLDAASMAAYLAGIGHLQQRNADNVARARELLAGLVDAHPDFADGHAELAIAELLATEYGLQPLDEGLRRAGIEIAAALRLESGHGLAHAAGGLAAMMRGRYREAQPLLLAAHRNEPGHDAIQHWLGNALLYGGQPREAMPWLTSAAELNPGLLAARISIGEARCYAGDEPTCVSFLMAPPESPMQSYVALLLRAHRGDHAAVHAELQASPPAVDPAWVRGLRADCCRAAGLEDCADREPDVTARPLEADLWQLDLGLADALAGARSDATLAAELRAEVELLRAGGVRLAVLEALAQCLDQSSVGDPALARLLGCAPADH